MAKRKAGTPRRMPRPGPCLLLDLDHVGGPPSGGYSRRIRSSCSFRIRSFSSSQAMSSRASSSRALRCPVRPSVSPLDYAGRFPAGRSNDRKKGRRIGYTKAEKSDDTRRSADEHRFGYSHPKKGRGVASLWCCIDAPTKRARSRAEAVGVGNVPTDPKTRARSSRSWWHRTGVNRTSALRRSLGSLEHEGGPGPTLRMPRSRI
jgi:hypothetical protein